jgi:hypothetical protein
LANISKKTNDDNSPGGKDDDLFNNSYCYSRILKQCKNYLKIIKQYYKINTRRRKKKGNSLVYIER